MACQTRAGTGEDRGRCLGHDPAKAAVGNANFTVCLWRHGMPSTGLGDCICDRYDDMTLKAEIRKAKLERILERHVRPMALDTWYIRPPNIDKTSRIKVTTSQEVECHVMQSKIMEVVYVVCMYVCTFHVPERASDYDIWFCCYLGESRF